MVLTISLKYITVEACGTNISNPVPPSDETESDENNEEERVLTKNEMEALLEVEQKLSRLAEGILI